MTQSPVEDFLIALQLLQIFQNIVYAYCNCSCWD